MENEKPDERAIVIRGETITTLSKHSTPFSIPLSMTQRKEIRHFMNQRTHSVSDRIRTIKKLSIDANTESISDKQAQTIIDKLKLTHAIKEWNKRKNEMGKLRQEYLKQQQQTTDTIKGILDKAKLDYSIPYRMTDGSANSQDLEREEIIDITRVKKQLATQMWDTQNEAKFQKYQLKVEQLEKLIEERILFGTLLQVEPLLQQYFKVGDDIDKLDSRTPETISNR